MSFFQLLLAPRTLVALALTVATCWVGLTYSVHHVGKNAFETLYLHLLPAELVHPHDEGAGDHAAATTDAEHGADHATEAADEAGEHGDEHAEHVYRRADYLFTLPVSGPLELVATNGPEIAAGTTDEAPFIALTNLQLFQLLAVLLLFVCFSGVPGYLRSGRGDALTKLFAGWALWVRDDMVYSVMGKDLGRKFLPYFLFVFFFVLFMNLLGLVPGSATATASVYITGALALTTLGAMLGCGMVHQGPVAFWKNLVPHVPAALWPLMFVVELIGVLVKPFALMVRLFANMTGGHMVVLSFMGLIFFFGLSFSPAAGFGVSPVAVAFGVFIMIIEVFVAMVQAFVFTQLSVIFVNMSVHPEH